MKRNLSLIAICILLAAGCGKDPVPGINDEDKKPGTEVPGNTDKPDDVNALIHTFLDSLSVCK